MLHCSWADPWLSGGTILSHHPQEEQKVPFLQAGEGKGLRITSTTPQTTGSLQPVGPGCPKEFSISITLFIQSVWDYPPSQPFLAGQAAPRFAANCAITFITHIKQDKQPPCFKPLPFPPLWQQLSDAALAGKRRLCCPKQALMDHAAGDPGSSPI